MKTASALALALLASIPAVAQSEQARIEYVVQLIRTGSTPVDALLELPEVASCSAPGPTSRAFHIVADDPLPDHGLAIHDAVSGKTRRVWSIRPRESGDTRTDLLRSIAILERGERMPQEKIDYLVKEDPRTQRRLAIARVLERIVAIHASGDLARDPFAGNTRFTDLVATMRAHTQLTRARGFEFSSIPDSDPRGVVELILDLNREVEDRGIDPGAGYLKATGDSKLRHVLGRDTYAQVVERQLAATLAHYRLGLLRIARDCERAIARLETVGGTEGARRRYETTRVCALGLQRLLY